MNNLKEYIVCAAIHFQDGIHYNNQPLNVMSGLVICGYRHGSIFGITKGLNYKKPDVQIQGFLTSRNRFVDRTEAKILALNCGQICENTDPNYTGYTGEELFSEDLYSSKD